MSQISRRLFTFAIAALGTVAFWALGLPLPFLFGPMGACLLTALAGAQLRDFGKITVAGRTILGVAIGASLTPAVLAMLPQVALSVAIIPLYLAAIASLGVPYFRRVWGYDPATAYYAAMPGGLQDMVIFGTEAGANPRTLSLIHATRVLLIVTLAPVVMVVLFGRPLTNTMGAPMVDIPMRELVLMALAAFGGWQIAARGGLFGASILGPMIAAAALALTDVIHHRPPKEAILVAQFLIGTGIGVHYVGVTWAEVRRTIVSALGFVVIIGALAAALALVVPLFTGLGSVEAFLAFAPGGQAEMTVLAIVAGADLGVVIAHHVMRIVLVITCAPLAARFMGGAKPRD